MTKQITLTAALMALACFTGSALADNRAPPRSKKYPQPHTVQAQGPKTESAKSETAKPDGAKIQPEPRAAFTIMFGAPPAAPSAEVKPAHPLVPFMQLLGVR